jgi:hypothetical protein
MSTSLLIVSLEWGSRAVSMFGDVLSRCVTQFDCPRCRCYVVNDDVGCAPATPGFVDTAGDSGERGDAHSSEETSP